MVAFPRTILSLVAFLALTAPALAFPVNVPVIAAPDAGYNVDAPADPTSGLWVGAGTERGLSQAPGDLDWYRLIAPPTAQHISLVAFDAEKCMVLYLEPIVALGGDGAVSKVLCAGGVVRLTRDIAAGELWAFGVKTSQVSGYSFHVQFTA